MKGLRRNRLLQLRDTTNDSLGRDMLTAEYTTTYADLTWLPSDKLKQAVVYFNKLDFGKKFRRIALPIFQQYGK